METPIELLKKKLAELTLISGTEPELLIEYEKAILILELIGSDAFDEIINKPYAAKTETGQSDFGKESKSYYERFMENQKNKKKG